MAFTIYGFYAGYLHFRRLKSIWTADKQAVSLPAVVSSLITLRQMKQTQGLELISSVEWPFGSCLAGASNMTSKDISMQGKEAVIGHKNKTNQSEW